MHMYHWKKKGKLPYNCSKITEIEPKDVILCRLIAEILKTKAVIIDLLFEWLSG